MDSTSKARRAASQKLRKYDARCCIIFTEGYFGLRRMLRSGFVHLRRPSHFSNLSSFHSEGYRSGHNEAVLKTVCRQARGFESHTLRHILHKKKFLILAITAKNQGLFLFLCALKSAFGSPKIGLSERTVCSLQPAEKPYRIRLFTSPTSSRMWCFRAVSPHLPWLLPHFPCCSNPNACKY